MELSEFYYDLPEELIAQTPIKKRDESRLMVLDKNTGKIEHKIFKDIILIFRNFITFRNELFMKFFLYTYHFSYTKM